MNWFKSIWLTSEERRILKEARAKKLEELNGPVHQAPVVEVKMYEKPYQRLLYNHGVLTIIFHDGDVISAPRPTEDFNKVQNLSSRIDIEKFLFGNTPNVIAAQEKNVEEKEKEAIKDALEVIRYHADFTVNGDDVYLKGVNLPIPTVIMYSFIEILEKMGSSFTQDRDYEGLEDQYNALKMFWLWLALNPIEQSRNDLLGFVKQNDVKITKNGNLILYRRIVSTADERDNKLTEFISQSYVKVKRQKKGPGNFTVISDDQGYHIFPHNVAAGQILTGSTMIGNLKDLYNSLDSLEENDYTSHYNHGQNKIKVGSIYKIPEDQINLDNGNCAAGGLHAAAVDYDYSGFGDTPVVVLVNPSKAITVPTHDMGKLRTTEMFIVCINDKGLGEHFEEADLLDFDDEYHTMTMDELEGKVSKKDFGSLGIKDKQLNLSPVEVTSIKDLLKKRVQEVV